MTAYNRCIVLALLQVFLKFARPSNLYVVAVAAATTTNEEYDYSILDPLSAFGTPYGGWSRASRARLESLPLVIPFREEDAHKDTADDADPSYMPIRDALGQLYVCRVYREDELEPKSLEDGMFVPPRLKQQENDTERTEKADQPIGSQQDSSEDSWDADRDVGIPSELAGRRMADLKIEIAKVSINPGGGQDIVPGNLEVQEVVKMDGVDLEDLTPQGILDMIAVNAHLGQLMGTCAHIHLGWWSYEWCFEMHVAQFHVSIDQEELKALDLTSLGEYHSRRIETDLQNLPVNQLAQGSGELGRVIETYIGGDPCPGTGKPRSSTVMIVCCGDEVMAKHRTMNELAMKQTGQDPSAPIKVAIHSVHEREVCEYDVSVCSPLLCSDSDAGPATTEKVRILSGTKVNPFSKKRPSKKVESIREILDRTLGEVCIQTAAPGWWTYEFCHGGAIRQFHEELGTRKTARGTVASRILEAEHILGVYPEDLVNNMMDSEEHEHVVNTTVAGKAIEKGGNGAYYEVEYVGGNVCDESEVTERAIVAGGSLAAGKLSRASSVRYFCGPSFSVSVSEDSTCHYIVEVTVPDLCDHTLFKAPATVKQVIKCLPVDEDDDSSFLVSTVSGR